MNEAEGTRSGAYEYRSGSEADTARLAAALAELAGPGAMLALDGDLGAGKTSFSKAMAQALGVPGVVNSPTFTIIKEYEGAHMPLYHMDVYRLSVEEAAEMGLDDYFYGEGVTIVEWAERIRELLPEERLELYLEAAGEQERVIRLKPAGSRYEAWCAKLEKNGVVVSA